MAKKYTFPPARPVHGGRLLPAVPADQAPGARQAFHPPQTYALLRTMDQAPAFLPDQTGAPMSENIVMITAYNLQQRRQKADLTQKEVARLLGLKAETICRMEKGHNPVSLRRLQQFADLYGCTVIDFLQPPQA